MTSLTPNAIIQAAERDIEVVRHNKALAADRAAYRAAGASGKAAGISKRTAFLPQHVRYATKPSHVIRAAIKGQGDGMKADSAPTRLLYQSEILLLQAATLAEEYGY